MGTFLKNLQGAACVLALGSGGVVFAQVAPGWSERGDYRAPVEEWEQQLAMLLSPVILPEPITATLPDGREAVFKFVQRINESDDRWNRASTVELRRVIEDEPELVILRSRLSPNPTYNALFAGSGLRVSSGTVGVWQRHDGAVEVWAGSRLSNKELFGPYAGAPTIESWVEGGAFMWRSFSWWGNEGWVATLYGVPLDFDWLTHGRLPSHLIPHPSRPSPPKPEIKVWDQPAWPSDGAPLRIEHGLCPARKLDFVPRARLGEWAHDAFQEHMADLRASNDALRWLSSDLLEHIAGRMRADGPGPFGAIGLPHSSKDFPKEFAPALRDAARVDEATLGAWLDSGFPPAIALAIYELDRRGEYPRLWERRSLLEDRRVGLLRVGANGASMGYAAELIPETIGEQLVRSFSRWFADRQDGRHLSGPNAPRWEWLNRVDDPSMLLAPRLRQIRDYYELSVCRPHRGPHVPARQHLTREELVAGVEALMPARRAILAYLAVREPGMFGCRPSWDDPHTIFIPRDAYALLEEAGLAEVRRVLGAPIGEGGEPLFQGLWDEIEAWMEGMSVKLGEAR